MIFYVNYCKSGYKSRFLVTVMKSKNIIGDFLNTKEVCKLLSISRPTLLKYKEQFKLKTVLFRKQTLRQSKFKNR